MSESQSARVYFHKQPDMYMKNFGKTGSRGSSMPRFECHVTPSNE